MTLGEQLIVELGRRGERGMYFDYAGYQALRAIDSLDSLRQFVHANPTFARLQVNADMDELADSLARAYAASFEGNLLKHPFGHGPLGVALWLVGLMAHVAWRRIEKLACAAEFHDFGSSRPRR